MKHPIQPSPPNLPTVDALLAYGRARSLAMTLETFPPWSFRAFQRLAGLAKMAWLNALVFWILVMLAAPGLSPGLAATFTGIVAGMLVTAVASTLVALTIRGTSAWNAKDFASHPAGTPEGRRELLEFACDHRRIVDVGFQAWREYVETHQATDRIGGYRDASGGAGTAWALEDIATLENLARDWGREYQRSTLGRRDLDFFYGEFVAMQAASR